MEDACRALTTILGPKPPAAAPPLFPEDLLEDRTGMRIQLPLNNTT